MDSFASFASYNDQFTDEMMSELTYYVDVEGREVDEVAHEFLVSAGLLEE